MITKIRSQTKTTQLKLDRTRFKPWQIWESEGVPVEYMTRLQSPDGLTREGRETTVKFLHNATIAEVMTALAQWVSRLEGSGLKPIRILAFEQGDGEMRWYPVPKGWIKRPYGHTRKGKYLRWEDWQSQGVFIQHSSQHFPLEERETCLALIDSEPMMEIDTCYEQWHRRLEAEGAQPYAIDAALDGHGESRSYQVPKSWVRLPGPLKPRRK